MKKLIKNLMQKIDSAFLIHIFYNIKFYFNAIEKI